MTRHCASLVIAVLLIVAADVNAQTGSVPPPAPVVPIPAAGEIQELQLRDGSRAYGQVAHVENGVVTFKTAAGAIIQVPAAEVASVRTVAGRLVNGEFLRADANPTRLFFAPTARSLKRGEAYLGVYEIVMPFVQVGLTDRVSFGAGTPLLFGAGNERPFWITPKVQVVSSRHLDAALGVMHFLNVGDGSFGIAYAVVSRGNRDSAVTGGVGYAYERYGDDQGAAIGMLGGEHRVLRGLKLITENYVWSGGGITTGGVRFLGERFSTDLGLALVLGEGELIGFPVISFVWNFARQ